MVVRGTIEPVGQILPPNNSHHWRTTSPSDSFRHYRTVALICRKSGHTLGGNSPVERNQNPVSTQNRFLYLALHILLWSILCKTVGLPSSTGESERTARRQLHSPTLRCFRGHLCEVAAGRGPLKQSRWAESNWTLPLRSVGVAPSLGRFWLVFAALKLRYVLRRHIILSDSDGNQAVLDCFTVSPGLGGSAK